MFTSNLYLSSTIFNFPSNLLYVAILTTVRSAGYRIFCVIKVFVECLIYTDIQHIKDSTRMKLGGAVQDVTLYYFTTPDTRGMGLKGIQLCTDVLLSLNLLVRGCTL